MTYIWLNQRLHSQETIGLPIEDRGFLLGDGLFETMRVSHTTIPHIDRHLTRLEKGCSLLRIPIPKKEHLAHAAHTLIQANTVIEGSIRLTLSRGTGPRGLTPPTPPSPTILITSSPAGLPHTRPITLHISSYKRDEASPLTYIKSLNALPSILARIEAQEHNAHDALMLNHQNNIAETTSATFIALKNNQLCTPTLSEGALPGISRARLLEASLCHEEIIAYNDIPHLQGAWVVTALSLTPVKKIANHSLKVSSSLTQKLHSFLY